MFLLRYRFSWFTCYDWYSVHWSGFVTCISLPLYRKSSSGFGIQYTILAFCRCCVIIFIYFNLLLRFISDAALIRRIGIFLIFSTANFIYLSSSLRSNPKDKERGCRERGNDDDIDVLYFASKRGNEDISGDDPEVKEDNPGDDSEVSPPEEVLDEIDDMKRTKSLAKDLLDNKVGETYDDKKPVRPKEYRNLEEIKKEYSSFFDEDSQNNTTEGLEEVLDYIDGELSNLSGNTSGSKEMKKELDNIFKEEQGNSNKKLKTESEAETEAKPSKGKGKEVEVEAEAETEAKPSKGKEVETESKAPKVEGEVKPTNYVEKPQKTYKDILQKPSPSVSESELPNELPDESEDCSADFPIDSDDFDIYIYPDYSDLIYTPSGIDYIDIINIIIKIL